MKRVLTLTCTVFYSLLTALSSLPAHAQFTLPWENPTVTPGLPQPPDSSPDQTQVPERLTSTDGKLIAGKPTAIFIHGWTADGRAENYFEEERWEQAGFNTFILRWHRDAFQAALIPTEAEQRVWKNACYKWTPALYKLAELTRTENSEIRLAGHSLGSQLAVCLASVLISVGVPGERLRIELLDPWITPGARIPKEFRLSWVPHQGEISLSMAVMLHGLRQSNAAVVTYASAAGEMTASTLASAGHFQSLSPEWLGGDWGVRHLSIRDWYFQSISEPLPSLQSQANSKAFSARSETPQLKSNPVRKFRQISGEKTLTIRDDVFEQVR